MCMKALVVGDLHMYDKQVGYHIDYEGQCLKLLDDIELQLIEEAATHLLFTGDLSGALTARRFQTHVFRLKVIQKFVRFNELTNGNVFMIRGNHDNASKDLSEYDFFQGLDLIKNVDRLVFGKKAIHFVNFGETNRTLDIVSPGKDILITHEDLSVENEIMWYYAGQSRKLESCAGYAGIGVVLAGHIHNPSPRVITTTLGGYPVDLVYLGGPTRPVLTLKDMWTSVYIGVITEASADEFDIDLKIWELPSLDETFDVYRKIEDVKTGEEKYQLIDAGAIKDIRAVLTSMQEFGLGGDTVEQQILHFAPTEYPDNVRKIALKYYSDQA